jgi:class 3 adenylate cyclase
MADVKIVDGLDRGLREVAEELAPYGWAAELLDTRWRLVWVSDELQTIYGREQLRLGAHILRSRRAFYDAGSAPHEKAEGWFQRNVPFMLEDSEGGREAIAEMLGADFASVVADAKPRCAPPFWAGTIAFRRGEFFGSANYVAESISAKDVRLLGYLFLYGPTTPASLAALLVRGDRRVYERMAALLEPSQREATILFADLEGSGVLSRHLPSPAYFRLISDIRNRVDALVADCGGIVGKHAGDGVIAFFLPDQVGSASASVRSALEVARRIPQLSHDVATDLANEQLPVEPDDCRMKVAVHWGSSVYMGQVASQGRLEVTALGDEMNEAARIEQSTLGGQVLASKALLERLDRADAAALNLDPTTITYTALAELEGVSEKTARDAGTVAVADISHTITAAP